MRSIITTIIIMVIVAISIVVGCDKVLEKIPVNKGFQKIVMEEDMKVKIYRTCKDNPLPTFANPTDAGADVYAAEDVEFKINDVKLVPLGIIAQAPEGYHFKLCLRSSMGAKRGFRLANHVGIVDSTYSGPQDEIKMILEYTTNVIDGYPGANTIIKKGERIGQLILEKNNEIEWDEQEDINFAGKSRGGFGSSGK
jgi:dUTP pyrophosphatase